jgi:hypothetical protein
VIEGEIFKDLLEVPVESEFDFATQMEFFIAELTRGSGWTDTTTFIEGDFIANMNRQTNPKRASDLFCWRYERAVIGGVTNTCQKGG